MMTSNESFMLPGLPAMILCLGEARAASRTVTYLNLTSDKNLPY
jgi:hypothetical protein